MFNSNIKLKLNELKSNPKFIKILIVISLILVILIYFSEFFTTEKATGDTNVFTQSTEEYKSTLEKQLKNTLKNINGVGDVKVMIMLDSNSEIVYQNEKEYKTTKKDSSEEYNEKNQTVMVDNGSSDEGLIRKINEPQIRGVLIICDGADNITVKTKVTEAVKKLFCISTARICVTN